MNVGDNCPDCSRTLIVSLKAAVNSWVVGAQYSVLRGQKQSLLIGVRRCRLPKSESSSIMILLTSIVFLTHDCHVQTIVFKEEKTTRVSVNGNS